MPDKNSDIDKMVTELDYLADNPGDGDALTAFADSHAREVIRLLEELRGWRSEAEKRTQNSARRIVEGFSENSMKEAFGKALDKAMHMMSETHDTNISVIGLVHLPRGGYHATLEVLISPMALTLHAHKEGQDVELKHINERDYRRRKLFAETHMKELVHEHFLQTTGGAPDVPDYFMVNVNDAALLNYMIEKEFFHAGHHDPDAPGPVVIKVNRNGPQNKPE